MAPKTASASVLPETWAIPQSSRTIVIFAACCSQREASDWNARAAERVARSRTSVLKRKCWFIQRELYRCSCPIRARARRSGERGGGKSEYGERLPDRRSEEH